MPNRTNVGLWGIAMTLAVLWSVMHFQRPASFPWMGILAAAPFIVPLFIHDWIASRKQREHVRRNRQDRIDRGRFA